MRWHPDHGLPLLLQNKTLWSCDRHEVWWTLLTFYNIYPSWAKLRFWSMNFVPYSFCTYLIRWYMKLVHILQIWIAYCGNNILKESSTIQGFTKTLLMMSGSHFKPYLSFLDWMLPYLSCEIKLYRYKVIRRLVV